jgi:flagellar protein FliJ
MSSNNPSLDPLMALLSQAERERDEALADARRAGDAHQAAALQAEQLVAYRVEYEARFREQFSRQNSIEVLQCYQGFTVRLTQAIDQQKQVVVHATLQLEQARALVCEQELRVASVRKLLERRLNEMRQTAQRHEQKQSDEFAARAAWGRLSAQTVLPAA